MVNCPIRLKVEFVGLIVGADMSYSGPQWNPLLQALRCKPHAEEATVLS